MNSKTDLHDNAATLLPPPAPATVADHSGSKISARKKRKKKAKAKEFDLEKFTMYNEGQDFLNLSEEEKRKLLAKME